MNTLFSFKPCVFGVVTSRRFMINPQHVNRKQRLTYVIRNWLKIANKCWGVPVSKTSFHLFLSANYVALCLGYFSIVMAGHGQGGTEERVCVGPTGPAGFRWLPSYCWCDNQISQLLNFHFFFTFPPLLSLLEFSPLGPLIDPIGCDNDKGHFRTFF